MASTTVSRQTRIPTPDSSLVQPAPNQKPLSLTSLEETKERIRMETLAKMDIESEGRELRRIRKEAEQEARNKANAIKDDQIQKDKDEAMRREIMGMSEKEFRNFQKRVDYMTPAMEETIRERSGLPTVSKAIKSTKSDTMLEELKRRGVVPKDFQPLSTMPGSPVAEDAPIDLDDPEENAAG